MALIDRALDRFGLDRDRVRRLARQGLAVAVRALADALREHEDVVVGTVGGDVPAPPAPSAAPPAPVASPVATAEVHTSDEVDPPGVDEPVVSQPAKAKVAEDATVARYGAAAWVDKQQEERAAAPATPSAAGVLHDQVIDVLHTIYDPEIPVDIYELGLIYAVDVRADASVYVRMTLTSPNCPAAQSLPGEVEVKVASVEGVNGAEVEVVFEPPWTPDLMSDEAKLELNL